MRVQYAFIYFHLRPYARLFSANYWGDYLLYSLLIDSRSSRLFDCTFGWYSVRFYQVRLRRIRWDHHLSNLNLKGFGNEVNKGRSWEKLHGDLRAQKVLETKLVQRPMNLIGRFSYRLNQEFANGEKWHTIINEMTLTKFERKIAILITIGHANQ